jgi:hypothetical protein
MARRKCLYTANRAGPCGEWIRAGETPQSEDLAVVATDGMRKKKCHLAKAHPMSGGCSARPLDCSANGHMFDGHPQKLHGENAGICKQNCTAQSPFQPDCQRPLRARHPPIFLLTP